MSEFRSAGMCKRRHEKNRLHTGKRGGVESPTSTGVRLAMNQKRGLELMCLNLVLLFIDFRV
jgi:hypothetical protein